MQEVSLYKIHMRIERSKDHVERIKFSEIEHC
jgi:hypothetical protein